MRRRPPAGEGPAGHVRSGRPLQESECLTCAGRAWRHRPVRGRAGHEAGRHLGVLDGRRARACSGATVAALLKTRTAPGALQAAVGSSMPQPPSPPAGRRLESLSASPTWHSARRPPSSSGTDTGPRMMFGSTAGNWPCIEQTTHGRPVRHHPFGPQPLDILPAIQHAATPPKRMMFLNSNFEIFQSRRPCDATPSCTMFLNSNFEISDPNRGGHVHSASQAHTVSS